jgi:hypothetical protein
VNLAEVIGTEYTSFGILLLEDYSGERTEAIMRELRHRAAAINIEIFRRWVKEEGLKPVSWSTLVGVLEDIGLNVLAGDVSLTSSNGGGSSSTPSSEFALRINRVLQVGFFLKLSISNTFKY